MTIFLMVLKQLIKEQLGPLSTSLRSKARGFGYNSDLSTDQKLIVDQLDEQISRFESSGDDMVDSTKIVGLIESARDRIEKTREEYGEPREEGETFSCLNGLHKHSCSFYKKLVSFTFPLLNKTYSETPENIIYYHSVYYFGEEIFVPQSSLDVDMRNEKEEKLRIRLQSLSEIIKPSYNLNEQRVRCLQVLSDLASDNKLVIKKDKEESTAVAVPGMSFFGISFTLSDITNYFSAGTGRMGEQFNLAARRINKMTEKEFQPPIITVQTGKTAVQVPKADAPVKTIAPALKNDEEEQEEESLSVKV